MSEIDERRDLLRVFESYFSGRMARRDFLRACGIAGLSLASSRILSGCERFRMNKAVDVSRQILETVGPDSAIDPKTDQHRFLSELKRRFQGTTLNIVCEDTPPATATAAIMKEEFMPLTGITVNWERLPLDKVLAKIIAASALRTGDIDLFYIDEGWLARLAGDLLDHRSMLERTDLAYPGYEFSDILPELVRHIGTYRGKLIGIPFDIPIHMMVYRKDILDRLKVPPPTTLPDYLKTVETIRKELGPRFFGTTGMWKAGHYALYIETSVLLWAHGGSVYGADGRSRLNDDRAAAALSYMRELGKWMPPAVTTWGWDEAALSFAQGNVGIALLSGEYFPGFDSPATSQIVGLAEPAPCPREIALRPPEECGFEETPGISRQGGSCIGISRYCKQPDAAWVLLQWATSSDVTTRASLLGGGSSPIRSSNYSDPRILARAKVRPGTTRHFPVALDAIRKRMGTDPHLPRFDELVTALSIELGRFTTSQQDIKTTLKAMDRAANALARTP